MMVLTESNEAAEALAEQRAIFFTLNRPPNGKGALDMCCGEWSVLCECSSAT